MKQLLYKIIYNPGINFVLRNLNKGLSPILPKRLKLPPSGIITIKKDGKQLKIACNQTNYLTYLIFWNGFEKFEYSDIFLSLIKKVNTFYDIGANIGYYSLLAEFVNPKIKVVSFEPAAGPLFYFKENIRLNGYQHIKAESIALSQQTGEIEFYEIQNKKYSYLKYNLAGESNAGSKTSGRNFMIHKVPTVTFDDYVSINHEGMIDLIKMDTEGTENLILEKAGHILKNMKPVIICETLFNTIEPQLEAIMKSYGYEFYNHTESGLLKVDSIQRKIDNGVNNCFFVHPEKFHLIEEYVVAN